MNDKTNPPGHGESRDEQLRKVRNLPEGSTIPLDDAKAKQILPRRFPIGSRRPTERESESIRLQIKTALEESRELQSSTPDIWEEAALELADDLSRNKKAQDRPRPSDWGKALTRLVNLNSPQSAETFHRDHPQFFPRMFFQLETPPQESVTDMTDSPEVGLSAVMPVLPLWIAWRDLLRNAWQTKFAPDHLVQLLNIPTEQPSDLLPRVRFQPVFEFQRAILWLADSKDSWRAKFCTSCGKPFVAAEPADKYCGDACADEARRAQNRRHYRDYGKDWRKRNRAAKKKQRQRSKKKR